MPSPRFFIKWPHLSRGGDRVGLVHMINAWYYYTDQERFDERGRAVSCGSNERVNDANR